MKVCFRVYVFFNSYMELRMNRRLIVDMFVSVYACENVCESEYVFVCVLISEYVIVQTRTTEKSKSPFQYN